MQINATYKPAPTDGLEDDEYYRPFYEFLESQMKLQTKNLLFVEFTVINNPQLAL